MDTKKIETVLTTVTIDSKVDSGKIDVVVGESAKMDVVKAVNYIQSGKAEIEAGVTAVLNQVDDHVADKTAEFDQNAQDKTDAFNSNAVEKTGDFNDNYTSKLNAFNQNAQDKTDAFDLNASDKTGDFNTNATNKTTDFNDNYTAKKALIDAEVAVAEGYSAEAKQWAIGEPSEPSEGSAKYWAEQASHNVVNNGQLDIQVNGSSIATFTANQSGNTTANIVVGSGLPDQTGNAGKFLSTDGSDASWQYALNYRGDYNDNTQYYPGDVVRYFYESMYRKFLCISAIIRRNPLAQDYWVDLTGYITEFQTSSDDCPILSYTADGWTGNRMSGIRLKVPYGQNNYSKVPTINLYSGLLKVPGGIDGYYTSAQVDALIPTVNNSTITFTQGGVNKGSFTLNQSSGATIALDAGGAGGIQNTATGTDSLTILGNPASDDFFINIGSGSGINITATEEEILCPASIAIGVQDNSLEGAKVGGEHAIAIGTGTNAEENGIAIGYASQSGTIGVAVGVSSSVSNNGVAVGGGASASGASAVAIGTSSNALSTNSISIGNNSLSQVNRYATNGIGINGKVTGTTRASANNSIGIGGNVTNAQNAIQLGSGTNSTANSLQVGSYQLLDTSTGLIPDARISANIARTADVVSTSDLATCHVVVETYHNGVNWYRVYSDGWCEQGQMFQTIANNTNITFLKPFASNSYSLSTTNVGAGVSGYGGFQITNRTSTGFTVTDANYGSNDKTACWEAKGYIA